jgi:hypothetical protein
MRSDMLHTPNTHQMSKTCVIKDHFHVIKDQSTKGLYQCWWVIFYFYDEPLILKTIKMILVPQKNLNPGKSNCGLVFDFFFSNYGSNFSFASQTWFWVTWSKTNN